MRLGTVNSGKSSCYPPSTKDLDDRLTGERYTTKAFGQLVGKAAKVTIVEAENIVPVGDIHPDNVHLQGIYVDRIVPSTVEKVIEIRKLKEVEGEAERGKKSEALLRRERIARRTSKVLKHGYYVNLGVGEFAKLNK
jgi:3-oxoacid CoA-transferase